MAGAHTLNTRTERVSKWMLNVGIGLDPAREAVEWGRWSHTLMN